MLFKLLMFTGLLQQEYWSGLPFPLPVDHFVSELSPKTCPSWVALHGVAHSFIELCKSLHHGKAVIHEGAESMDKALTPGKIEDKGEEGGRG